MVAEKGTMYGSKIRIAAIKSGFLISEQVVDIMHSEYRSNVLTALIDNNVPHFMTDNHLRSCYARGGKRVQEKAIAMLVERQAPLVLPESEQQV